MEIQIEEQSPWTVFCLEGNLDRESSPSVYLRFHRELVRGKTHFYFDLDRVEAIEPEGLGVLVRCYKDATSRGGEVGLVHVSKEIEKVLEYTRLDSIFTLAGSRPLPSDSGPDLEAA